MDFYWSIAFFFFKFYWRKTLRLVDFWIRGIMIYCYEGNGFLEVLDQMHVCICPCMHLLKFYHQILLYLLQRNDPAYGDIEADRKGETSETLAQALQEKVLCTFVFSVIYPLCVCTFFFFSSFFWAKLECCRLYYCCWNCGLFARLQHYCFCHSRKKDIYWREMWMQLFRRR